MNFRKSIFTEIKTILFGATCIGKDTKKEFCVFVKLFRDRESLKFVKRAKFTKLVNFYLLKNCSCNTFG